MEITIRDVARAAGVSAGTASRALHGHPAISDDCVARVKEAARSLKYRPLRVHRKYRRPSVGLAGQTIAMVMLGMDRSLSTHPSVAEAIHGVESALTAAGAQTMLVDAPDIHPVPRVLEDTRPAGAILKGAMIGHALGNARTPLMNYLRDIPSVWVTGRPANCWGDSVAANDSLAGSLAARFLLDRGHKRLAVLNPKPSHLLFKRREIGFISEARASGAEVLNFSAATVEWKLPLRPPEDVACVQKLVDVLLREKNRPTAVFTPADSIAALVYRAFALRSVAVGRSISVISCNNDTPLIAGLFPSLTTIDIHARSVGQSAVEVLAWRLRMGTTLPPMEVLIEPSLIPGDSVGRPRGA